MIVTLIGNNSLALRQRLTELTSEFVKEYGDLALEQLDGEDDEAAAITEGLQSLPFLAKKKMVVVRNGAANKTFAEQIEQIISSINATTDTVFYEPTIDRRTAYFKVLKSHTKLEEFNELDSRQLAKWLVDEAKNRVGQLTFSDANYMVERLGANQCLLANELEKLLIYEPEISRANIDLLTEPTPQTKIFDLLDAAFGGKKDRALKVYEEQRAQKVEPQAILAMIAWQLQLLALVKYSKGKSATEVAKNSGMKEYPIRKAMNLTTKLSEEDLKKLISQALDMDLRSKTTSLDLDEALKTYIATL